jgi:hypothetical protein
MWTSRKSASSNSSVAITWRTAKATVTREQVARIGYEFGVAAALCWLALGVGSIIRPEQIHLHGLSWVLPALPTARLAFRTPLFYGPLLWLPSESEPGRQRCFLATLQLRSCFWNPLRTWCGWPYPLSQPYRKGAVTAAPWKPRSEWLYLPSACAVLLSASIGSLSIFPKGNPNSPP